MFESWSHQPFCSGSSLFCQLPLPELGDGLQRHSWLDIREEYNVFNKNKRDISMINDISFLHRIAAILDMILAVLSRRIIPQIGRQSGIWALKTYYSSTEGMSDIEEISLDRQDLPPACSLPQLTYNPSTSTSSSEVRVLLCFKAKLSLKMTRAEWLSRMRYVESLFKQL